jgi:hypothetical protein
MPCRAAQCLQEKVRQPISLHPVYPVLHCQFVPSASRLMALLDGMLPFGPLLQCFSAYVPPEVYPMHACVLCAQFVWGRGAL